VQAAWPSLEVVRLAGQVVHSEELAAHGDKWAAAWQVCASHAQCNKQAAAATAHHTNQLRQVTASAGLEAAIHRVTICIRAIDSSSRNNSHAACQPTYLWVHKCPRCRPCSSWTPRSRQRCRGRRARRLATALTARACREGTSGRLLR